MKKLISLLGAFGLLVTASSSVISCKQEAKSTPKPRRKTQLSEVLTRTDLSTIHVESTPKPSRNELVDDKLDVIFNLSRYIITRLIEINDDEKTGLNINPFELYVDIPTLVNHYGDMRTIVEATDASKNYTGHVEVTFNIDIDSHFIITQSHLGSFYAADETKFDLIDDAPTIKDEFLFAEIFRLNPKLADSRFEGKLQKVPKTFKWDEKTKTGQIEFILEDYQGSILINYTAYSQIQELVKNTDLGTYVTDQDSTTDENFLIGQLYLKNPDLIWIDRENIHVEYFPEIEKATVWIDNLEDQVEINFKRYFYPNASNVVTDLGEIMKSPGTFRLEPREIYPVWRALNTHLDPEFQNAGWVIHSITDSEARMEVVYQGRRRGFKLYFTALDWKWEGK